MGLQRVRLSMHAFMSWTARPSSEELPRLPTKVEDCKEGRVCCRWVYLGRIRMSVYPEGRRLGVSDAW